MSDEPESLGAQVARQTGATYRPSESGGKAVREWATPTPEDQRFEALREALAEWVEKTHTVEATRSHMDLVDAADACGYLGSMAASCIIPWTKAALAAHDQAKESGR